MGPVPLSVVILTYNEELNIGQCLTSVAGWAGEVFVVDSFSSDRTIAIARDHGVTVVQHEFSGYADQRNWALSQLPFSYEWALFLDADEALSKELKQELAHLDWKSHGGINGFYMKRRFVFMGRWIKHGGYYPTWLLRLFRWKVCRCEDRGVDEHFSVLGRTAFLEHDLIHENRRGLSDWIDKHNRYATLEALELIKEKAAASDQAVCGVGLRASLWGSQPERKRWIREHIWDRLPPLIRPFLYFFYRYFLRFGFLDGREGFICHFLQGLWYRLLVDIRLDELQGRQHRRETRGRFTGG